MSPVMDDSVLLKLLEAGLGAGEAAKVSENGDCSDPRVGL